MFNKLSGKIECLESELKWLRQRLEEAESNYVNDEEIDFSMIWSQVDDVERELEDVADISGDIKSAIEDLI